MVPSFDIFQIHSIGDVLWRDALESLVGVRVSIEKLKTSSFGEYVIFDQNTGQKIFVTLPGVSAKRGAQAVFKSILNTGRGPRVKKGPRPPRKGFCKSHIDYDSVAPGAVRNTYCSCVAPTHDGLAKL